MRSRVADLRAMAKRAGSAKAPASTDPVIIKARETLGPDISEFVDILSNAQGNPNLLSDDMKESAKALQETVDHHLRECPKCRMQTTFGRPPIQLEDINVKNLALLCEQEIPLLLSAIIPPLKRNIDGMLVNMLEELRAMRASPQEFAEYHEFVKETMDPSFENMRHAKAETERIVHLGSLKRPLLAQLSTLKDARKEILQYFGFPGASYSFRFKGTTRISLLDFRHYAWKRVLEFDRQMDETVTSWEAENNMKFEIDGYRFLEREQEERSKRQDKLKADNDANQTPKKVLQTPKRPSGRLSSPGVKRDASTGQMDEPLPSPTPPPAQLISGQVIELPAGLVEDDNVSYIAFRKADMKETADASGDSQSVALQDLATTEFDDSPQTRVVVRIRPLSEDESSRGEHVCVCACDDHQTVEFKEHTSKLAQINSLAFHYCMDQDITQQDFFAECGIKALLVQVLNGENATAMAYGQTGSGKTFTMSGPETNLGANPSDEFDDPENIVPGVVKQICREICEDQVAKQGLMPRCIKSLFQEIRRRKQAQPEESYRVQTSFFEIYNEKIMDLLSGKEDCNIRLHPTEGFYVEDAGMEDCENVQQLMAVYVAGMHNRTVSSTQMNKESSRSHSILQIVVTKQSPSGTTKGKLLLVDLAGSERLKQAHGAAGAGVRRNMAETSNINKSLLALSNVVSRLGAGETTVNYRDSNLTKLLMDSLSGSGTTLLVACLSPASSYIEESGNTLSFASKAANVVKKKVTKLTPHELEVRRLNDVIEELRAENAQLREQLANAQVGDVPPSTVALAPTANEEPTSKSDEPSGLSPSNSEPTPQIPATTSATSDSDDVEVLKATIVRQRSENAELKEALWEKVKALEKMATHWKNEVIRMRALLEEHGIDYAHLLQPDATTATATGTTTATTTENALGAKQMLAERIKLNKIRQSVHDD